MKVISPKVHAILDYLTVIFLMISPSLFLLSDVATKLVYLLSGIHLLLTICTNFKFGLFKVIPFRIHGLIEFFVAFGLVTAAFTYFKHTKVDQTFLTALGIIILVVFILTDFKQKKIR